MPVLAMPQHPLCPVAAYLAAERAVPNPGGDKLWPAFAIPPVGRAKRPAALSYPMLSAYLKQWLTQAGYDASLFSSHSIRRGGASSAFAAGVPGELIQLVGDWSSPVYQRYLEISTQRKLAVAARVKRHILTAVGCSLAVGR